MAQPTVWRGTCETTAMDDAAEWTIIFTDAGVDSVSAKVYAKKFAQEKLTMSKLEMLGRSMLTELGVSVMGDALSPLKLSKVAESKSTSARASVQLSSAKAPQLHAVPCGGCISRVGRRRSFDIGWGQCGHAVLDCSFHI